MNKLVLAGQLWHICGRKFVRFRTESREHILPIVADNYDTKDGEWVRFIGTLYTKSPLGTDGKHHKEWWAVGDLCKSSEGFYFNTLSCDPSKIISVGKLRTTALTKRKIVDFVVVNNGNYFNCIAFGHVADAICEKKRGDIIDIYSAKFHSRTYEKDDAIRTAYEVLVLGFM